MPRDVPIVNVIGAANVPPADHELDAFYDRFPVRLWVDSIFSYEEEDDPAPPEMRRARELLDLARRFERRRPDKGCACLSDFVVLQEYLLQRDPKRAMGPNLKKFVDAFLRLREKDYCRLSDRSLFTLARVAHAHDLLKSGDGSLENYLAVLCCVAPTLELSRRVVHDVASFADEADFAGEA